MTNRSFQALYMQKPVADEGNIIKRKWWQIWEHSRPEPESYDLTIMSMDTAYSVKEWGHYSAITIWGVFTHNGVPSIMLRDSWRDKVEYPDLRKIALEYKDRYKPDILVIEKKASGQSLSQDLKRLGFPTIDYRPDRDKMSRVQSAAAMIEAGVVWAKDTRNCEDVIDECASFPTGENDDLVDTVSQALIITRENGYLNTRRLYRDWEDSDGETGNERHVYY